MKKLLLNATILALVALGVGCSTPYMTDRGRDAADVFTAVIGLGGGVQARIGPVAQGLGFNVNYAGLQSGECFGGIQEYGGENGTDGAFLLWTGSDGYPSDVTKARRKHYKAFHLLGIAYPGAPCGQIIYPPPFFTQIEASIGVGGTLKLGLNPGELLDFLLGWAMLDIYGDDLETRKRKSNRAPEDTSLRADP